MYLNPVFCVQFDSQLCLRFGEVIMSPRTAVNVLLGLCLALSICQVIHGSTVVETKYGKIKGTELKTRSGKSYLAFTKIPYAKPPIGELRFERPQPPEKWTETLEGNHALPDCAQIPVFDPSAPKTVFGTEDCLYLSVFTPKASKSAKMAVMIYIHGGGWRSELPVLKGSEKAMNLMEEDVVLVTFHYRLGVFGFLSTEDSVMPGNMGMKDQNMVIRWVKDNIAMFGGDSDRITLFGNSAGAASTHLHLVSPMSKDLFYGGISQSGLATCVWAFSAPGVQKARAEKIAKHLNCPVATSGEILSCLKALPYDKIVESEKIMINRDFDPPIPFQPVIESGPDAFMVEHPYNLKINKPWMFGLTKEDGAFKTLGYIAQPELMESFNQTGYEILPEALMFTNTTTDVDKTSRAIFEKYSTYEDPIEGLTKLFTDGFFTSGIEQAMVNAHGNAYLYLFAHRGKTNSLDIISKNLNIDVKKLGAAHTDELFYLFNYEDEHPGMFDKVDKMVSKRVVKLWTDFAKFGFPKSSEDWEPYKNGKQYLKIAEHEVTEHDLWPERMSFWRNLPLRDTMFKPSTEDKKNIKSEL